MRILLVTFEEPFFLPMFFNRILKTYQKNIIGCLLHPYQSNIFSTLRELQQTHTPIEFAKLLFLYPLGSSVKKVMHRHKIPIYSIRKINSPKTKHYLLTLHPDVIIAQTNQIVPDYLLSIPKYGWLNKHASLLPKYRGLHPIFWALLHGEKEVGVTIHKMTSAIDYGPIFEQLHLPVQTQQSVYSLYKHVFTKGAKLMIDALQHLDTPQSTPRRKTRIFHTPRKSDIQKFRQKGYRFV